ncbi:hypothetical protein E4N89_10420 [Treponema denticola]
MSQDLIGLAENNTTLYGYVKNPNAWVDVFGLFKVVKNEYCLMVELENSSKYNTWPHERGFNGKRNISNRKHKNVDGIIWS